MREARLGDVVASMKNGMYKPASEYADNGMPCLRMYNIDAGSIVWRDIKRMKVTPQEYADYGLHEGDLLVNRVNSRELVGKAAVIPASLEPSVFESKNIRVRLDTSKALPKFINYQLFARGSRHFANNAQQVVGMASISQGQLSDFPIVLTGIDVQREIVAELEKQFSRLDEAVANLQRVKANLKRYKASVLNDAVEGRLVGSGYPAELVKLGSVANLIDPQPSHRTPPTHPDGVPYIGIGDVLENGKLDFQNSRKVSPKVLEEHRARYTLRIGDFIFGKIGTLGRPTLLRPPFTYTLSANVVLVQADGVRLLPEYALIFMDSPKLLNMISRDAKATTQAAYGIKRMRDLEINLPPVEQQRKIVAEVDRHLSIIREVEAEVDVNLQRAQALRQATLAKAFFSGAVHEPNY